MFRASRYWLILVLIFQLNASFAESADSLAVLLSRLDESEMRVQVLNQLSNQLKNSQPDKAYEYAIEALNTAGKIKYTKGVIRAHYFLGNIFQQKEQWANALNCYYTSLEMGKNINSREELGQSAP